MYFLSRNKEILKSFDSFFSISENTLQELTIAIEHVCNSGLDCHFETIAEKISEMEKEADNTRKAIEYKMISKSLLPETRQDLLEIIHLMDNIPDHCEKVVYIFNDQKTIPHKVIRKDLIELTQIGIQCFGYTVKAAYDFLNKGKKLESLIHEVDELEHVGDKLERKMTKAIFACKIGTGKKIIQQQIINGIGEIADVSKQAARRIYISSIKRRI